jgi:hypothetical protein
MKLFRIVAAGIAAVVVVGCGSSSSSAKVPTRDELVAQIVESGGVDQAVAECAADALFTGLSKDDLSKVVAGGEPSAAGKDKFTNSVLDCLTPPTEPVVTDAATTTVAPATTVAPTTTAAPATTVAATTTAAAVSGLSQFAATASATSEYGPDSWSANQATGAPTITECGDNTKAWASLQANSKDSITLGYATPVVASMVKISLSYHPGQVVMVEVLDTAGTATVVYEGEPAEMAAADCPTTMDVPVPGVADVNSVRITVDQSVIDLGWTEIDAVELIGTPA